MSTTLSDKPLSPGSLSPDEFSKPGYRAPHDANSRKRSGDDKADDANTARASAKKTAASVEDAQHFEEAMRSADQRSEDSDPDASAQQEADTQEDENAQDASGKMSFAALFTERFGAGAMVETAKAEATAESSQRDESLAQRLAERILVSETSVTGQEVRIQPSRDILPDTEICLVRGPDGLLSAVIHTDNPNSFQTLAAAQHDLRERLEQSEGQPVHVELRSSTDDGDPNRRSRGLEHFTIENG